MPLTDTAIRKAKPGASTIKLSDLHSKTAASALLQPHLIRGSMPTDETAAAMEASADLLDYSLSNEPTELGERNPKGLHIARPSQPVARPVGRAGSDAGGIAGAVGRPRP